jgi:hypothetical protein
MRRVVAAVGVALAVTVVVGPGAAGAHNAGRVELLVSNLQFSHDGPDTGSGVKVSADLVDRDSGASAAGFAVVVSAVGADGSSAGPVTLLDTGGIGHYEGRLAILPGSWTVTAKADQGTSALPALGSTRTTRLKFDARGVVARGASEGGTSDLGVWIALGVAGLVLAAGAFLMMTRRTSGPVTEPVGRAVGLLVIAVGVAALVGPIPGAGAQETTTTVPQYGSRPVNITLEVRTDYQDSLPSPLYIPLRARLTDPGTGQPVADPYTVQATVRVPEGAKEAYDFAYPHGTVAGAEAGAYNGVVIVPAGGRWTVIANAYDTREAEGGRLPRSLGVAQLEVEATGAALQTTQGRTSSDVAGNVNPRAETSEVALLFVHTVVGGLWFALAAVMVLLGLPNRRRLLSAQLSDLLDRNVRRLAQGLLWSTVLVWGTGLLNLQKAVPFAPPLSSAQATRLFRLPYAKPYTLALYTKIGLYALLTVSALALVKEARRRVAEFDDASFRADRAEAAAASATQSVRDAAVPPQAAIPLTPRRSATATATAIAPRPSAAARSSAALPPATSDAPAATFRIAAASLALGGGAIVFCVTVLKYCHILSEAVRGLQ